LFHFLSYELKVTPQVTFNSYLDIKNLNQQRLSNFLLYQLAYSELYFTETLWPDISEIHLTEALKSLEARQRNFGA